jgi:hypothetical protein
MIGNYMSVKEAAEKWELTNRMVQKMCSDGKIEGVLKFGKSWAIPKDAEKPVDNRIRNGDWIGYRKRREEKKDIENENNN